MITTFVPGPVRAAAAVRDLRHTRPHRLGGSAGVGNNSCIVNGSESSWPEPNESLPQEDFWVTGEVSRYKGQYLGVFTRRVRFPTAEGGEAKAEYDFDVIGDVGAADPGVSVFVFPYDAASGTATIIREYNPGPNRVLPGFVAGFVDRGRAGHETWEGAARMELSEEAGLRGGEMIELCGEMYRDKFAMDTFSMWLSVSAEVEGESLERDAEERLEVERGVTLEEVERMILAGEMSSGSAVVGLLGLREIRRRGGGGCGGGGGEKTTL